SNSPVMDYLDEGTRKQIFSWLGGNRAPKTYDEIIRALSNNRAVLQKQIVGESAANFNVQAAGTTSLRQLQSRRGLSTLALQTGQRFADIRGDVGAGLQFQLGAVYQGNQFDRAEILNRAAS